MWFLTLALYLAPLILLRIHMDTMSQLLHSGAALLITFSGINPL